MCITGVAAVAWRNVDVRSFTVAETRQFRGGPRVGEPIHHDSGGTTFVC
jgi:hypothetical protein